MRWWQVAMLTWVLSGCGLKKLLPEGPVISGWDRSAAFGPDVASDATYTGRAKVPYPILPIQIWGAAYDLDLVLVTRHPDWNMHEYAMLRTPDGPLWIAKDAREATLEQSVVADLASIDDWMPEIAVERRASEVEVVDRSTLDALDIELRYTNVDGQAVEVTYQGPPPRTLQKKRNGSTMGHSRGQLLAVLDLSHRDMARRATVTIGGEAQKIERILGLVAFRMALQQVQAGFAIADFTQRPLTVWSEPPEVREVVGAVPAEAASVGEGRSSAGPSFVLARRMRSGATVEREWDVRVGPRYVDAFQRGPERTLHYRYLVTGGAWELIEADAWQWGRASPTMHARLSPALPDLRRPFEGRHTSRFVIDVNGQPGHAVGTLEAWWEDGAPQVHLTPEAPWWTADRPMHTAVTFDDDRATVAIERTE